MNEKILILNFGKSNEVIASSHVISAYQDTNPHASISVLTYSENRPLFQTLENIKNIHTIDQQMIKNILENPLYSDAFAINSFMSSIEDVLQEKWDLVVNYTNDDVSSYLIKAINSTKIAGSYIGKNAGARTTNSWATYQNFVATGLNREVIPRPILRHYILGTNFNPDTPKIKINADYALIAGQNFSRIRQAKGSPSTLVVGISLEAGYDGHIIDYQTLEDIIDSLEDSKEFKPVLLLNGKRYQKDIADQLNKRFDNSLISINVDTIATSAVVTNLDILISPANDQLSIADALETKSIEIRSAKENAAPTSITTCAYVIYQMEASIADEISLILNEEFSSELPVTHMSSAAKVYKVVDDIYGSFYTQIRGELDVQKELRYHTERSAHYQMLGMAPNQKLLDHLKEQTAKEDLETYSAQTKDELTAAVKVLLATLRSLKAVRSSKKNLNQFISYLDTLISMGSDETTVGSILRFFEGSLENIESDKASESIDDNMKIIEEELFKLKGNLQLLTNIISDFIRTEDEMTSSLSKNEPNKSEQRI